MKILPGRIRADQTKLVVQNSYAPPRFYRDMACRCVDCKKEFVFTKEEQQVWYERYGIPHHATRARCKNCGKSDRARQKLAREYEQAQERLKSNPDDSVLLTTCAKCFVLYYEAWAEFETILPQRLEVTVGLLKRSLKHDSRLVESHYWMARCYQLLTRIDDTKTAFKTFIEKAERRKGVDRQLLKNAKAQLA